MAAHTPQALVTAPPAAALLSAPPAPVVDCGAPAQRRDAAERNMRAMRDMIWSPFGRQELGWEIYAPLIAQEIGTACPPDSPGFAAALAKWQYLHGQEESGVLDEAAFAALKTAWRAKRNVRRTPGSCPSPPHEGILATATAQESYGGKQILLRPGALESYRAMVRDAQAALPELRADPRLLTIFSAYRSPEYDAARCLRDRNCDGIRRAVSCSPHRTALAMDVFLGSAPGYGPDSTADANRLYQTRTPAYRWLVRNAHRYGFANYPFEPWHWEWTREAP
jgi:hypothetical protein